MKDVLDAYARVVRWDGESASELLNMLRSLAERAPRILLAPLPGLVQRLHRRFRNRFDLSRLREPILAIDKNGEALVGRFGSLHVVKLVKI
jgi:hypothetical protein